MIFQMRVWVLCGSVWVISLGDPLTYSWYKNIENPPEKQATSTQNRDSKKTGKRIQKMIFMRNSGCFRVLATSLADITQMHRWAMVHDY